MTDQAKEQLSEQSVLERLAMSLPNRWNQRNHQAELFLSYEAASAVWELEYCALDPTRNFTISADTLDEIFAEALDRIDSHTRS